jgi:hypothetical protein
LVNTGGFPAPGAATLPERERHALRGESSPSTSESGVARAEAQRFALAEDCCCCCCKVGALANTPDVVPTEDEGPGEFHSSNGLGAAVTRGLSPWNGLGVEERPSVDHPYDGEGDAHAGAKLDEVGVRLGLPATAKGVKLALAAEPMPPKPKPAPCCAADVFELEEGWNENALECARRIIMPP